MNVILLTSDEAQAVAGDYGPTHRLEPVDVGAGRFILPVKVLNEAEYQPVKALLSACPVVDYASLGVENGEG